MTGPMSNMGTRYWPKTRTMSSIRELGLDRLIECDYNSHINERLDRTMKIAAVSKLKAYLSDYLNQVKAGTEVLITDRGKPVARLVPISRTKAAGESLIRMSTPLTWLTKLLSKPLKRRD